MRLSESEERERIARQLATLESLTILLRGADNDAPPLPWWIEPHEAGWINRDWMREGAA